MRIHILGICGTFMAGVAELAKQSGHDVEGSDLNVYPPMSTQLAARGIRLLQGYSPENIDPNVDCVIVGNVIKRGNPAMEYVLENQIPYTSGPQWLAENILKNRWVLAVSGTHGKTTTTSLLAWILESAGKAPGFLIGGVPENFGVSARIGESDYFVIEADEYDSAFFDKRSKFIHYHPKTLILNNLEFDHADIFPDLEAIKQQFHYLIRTVPGNGMIIRHAEDRNLEEVLAKGCWTPVTTFGGETSDFRPALLEGITWDLLGKHNVENALAAIAAAQQVGVPVDQALRALTSFKNVKRRLEVIGQVAGVTVYDDFAHHPTAIATTLAGLRAKVGKARIIVVLEFGSYTMRTGVHKHRMKEALAAANKVFCKRPEGADWAVEGAATLDDIDSIVKNLVAELETGDHVIVMSNSGFGGIHQKILQAWQNNEKNDDRNHNKIDLLSN